MKIDFFAMHTDIAPSAIIAKIKTFIESGFVDVSMPRALAENEIQGVVADFASAALNAKKAFFDGIEIHVDAIIKVYPKQRVGIRLSPVSPANDAVTSDPNQIFGYLVAELARRGITYIHVIEGATGGARDNAV